MEEVCVVFRTLLHLTVRQLTHIDFLHSHRPQQAGGARGTYKCTFERASFSFWSSQEWNWVSWAFFP